jgi:hypothetical protein
MNGEPLTGIEVLRRFAERRRSPEQVALDRLLREVQVPLAQKLLEMITDYYYSNQRPPNCS